jgi:hypothetical protein
MARKSERSQAVGRVDAKVVAQRPVAGGYTSSASCVVTLADGRSTFVKAGVDEQTRAGLRAERRI